MIDGFLLGVVATSSVIAGVFFLRFWRDTRDALFFSFGIAFLAEGLNRCAMLLVKQPNEGSPWNYIVRFLAFLLILVGIVNKNRHSSI